jgi:N6-adenosine-specific RNA methylase IME4
MSVFPGMPHFGTYRVILADPPWEHDNYGQAKHGAAKSAYSEMPFEVLASMPVGELAHPAGALLFMWCTGPQAADGLHLELARAWGFRLTTRAFAWVKVNNACEACEHDWGDHERDAGPCVVPDERVDGAVCGCAAFAASAYFGPGNYTGQNVEDVWVGVRGDTPWPSLRARRDVRSVVFAPRGRHSAKPEAVQDRIEALWPEATPRLELFARRRRKGWAAWGNEAPGCDLVFGDAIGASWPLPARVEAPAVVDAQAALFSEGA